MVLRNIYVGVPARLASTRLPRKLLADIAGQTIVEHVCDRVRDLCDRLQKRLSPEFGPSFGVLPCVVTDDDEIESRALAKGVGTFRSQQSHNSGTSRIREWVQATVAPEGLRESLVVNVQGDEPFLRVEDVVQLIVDFVSPTGSEAVRQAPVATLVHRNTSWSAFMDPSCVKVVRGSRGFALYFSRAPVPWPRSLLGTEPILDRNLGLSGVLPAGWSFWQHIGIYVYRGWYLLHYPEETLVAKTQTDQGCDDIEGLEQLAVLAEGQSIWTRAGSAPGMGIDTEGDLAYARQHHKTLLQAAQSAAGQGLGE